MTQDYTSLISTMYDEIGSPYWTCLLLTEAQELPKEITWQLFELQAESHTFHGLPFILDGTTERQAMVIRLRFWQFLKKGQSEPVNSRNITDIICSQ